MHDGTWKTQVGLVSALLLDTAVTRMHHAGRDGEKRCNCTCLSLIRTKVIGSYSPINGVILKKQISQANWEPPEGGTELFGTVSGTLLVTPFISLARCPLAMLSGEWQLGANESTASIHFFPTTKTWGKGFSRTSTLWEMLLLCSLLEN